jgi:hypothetical protein
MTPAQVTVISGTVNASGTQANSWGKIAVTPTVLSANTVYYIFGTESGTDQWYDHQAVEYSSGAVVNNAAYLAAGAITDVNPGVAESYGPVNFWYI